MKESSYDFNNSMEQDEYEEEIYEETDKNKAIEEANNTMIASNKKEATTKKKGEGVLYYSNGDWFK